MLLTSLFIWAAPGIYESEEVYNELDRIFEERSQLQQAETDEILARYQPDNFAFEITSLEQVESDTVDSDRAAKENKGESRININSANATELQELPGIGPAYSIRIVEWRKENGSFTNKEQLLEIKGIGPARFDRIKDLIDL